MDYLKLPVLRKIVENIELKTAKLDKILAESQSHVATYLDIHYSDCQEIIFLLGGKAVKAGRFLSDGSRAILNAKDTLIKLKQSKEGSINFYEISKLLMIVILGTFIFEPTHAKLKSKQIDFKSLLGLLERKHFIGYLELMTRDGLNYLTFFDGKAREGYFCNDIAFDEKMDPADVIASIAEKSDEQGEINVYESVGEDDLHKTSGKEQEEKQESQTVEDTETEPEEQTDNDQYTSEMIDLCVVAIYEDFFRVMVNISSKQLDAIEVDAMFMKCLEEATIKKPVLFKGVGTKDNGTLLPTGLIDFERLLKLKEKLPLATREQDFFNGLVELAWLRLSSMKLNLEKELLDECISKLQMKIDGCKKNYQGSFTIIKFLYSFARMIEKLKSRGNE